MRKLYLIWRIWALTRNLSKISNSEGHNVLSTYYLELFEVEWPQEKK